MRRLRHSGRFPSDKLRAIALTAFADKEHEDEAMAAGFDAFMGKPLHSPTLVKIAAEFTRR